MIKLSFYLLFSIIITYFFAVLISFVKFRNGSLVFDVFSCMTLLILLICGIISIIHYQIISRGIQDKFPFIEEGEEFVLLIPVVNDELNGINIKDNLVKLESDQVESVMDDGIKENFGFYVTQSSGSLPPKRFRLQLDTSRECKILFNDDDFVHVGTQSLCILVKDISGAKKLAKECKDLHIKYPEVKDGVVWLHYDASKVVKDEETLKMLLSSFQEDDFTIYDLFVERLFHFCPGDAESIHQVEGKDVSVTKKEWINTPDGKMAVYFLSMFSPFKVLGRRTVHENEKGDLNEKIEYVLNHIEQNSITITEFSFTDLLECIKEKIFGNQKSEIPLYSIMNRNLFLAKDIKFSLSDLIYKDIESGIYKYILAIACVDDGGDHCPFAETNYFIRCLLCLQGYEGLVSQIRNVLNDYSGKIDRNSPGYKNLKIDRVMKTLLIKNSKECTNKELIKCARKYLVERYAHQIAMLTGRRSFFSEVGSIADFGLISEKIPQLLDDIAADSTVNSGVDIAGT